MKNILISLLMIITSCFNLSAQGYQVGADAVDFRLKNVDGTMVSLANFPEAKGFIVIFTCNHCPFSIAYEDRILALDAKYKKLGFPVIAINPNDPDVVPADGYKEMQLRSSEKGFTFPYLFDEGQKIYPIYGATRTPHVFLLQKTDDKLKVAYIGAIDDNSQEPEAVKEKYVENAVNALLAGKTPQPGFTKAIGCTIKAGAK
ncbi:MAG: thioredoxin family protein [Bacteroidales bacterium]|nr:thioredoxin family protein [Bacteroidales bacterium]